MEDDDDPRQSSFWGLGCCHRSAHSSTARVVTSPCSEPEGTQKKVNFAYVGDQQGAYDQVHNFSYVGDGQGSFSKEVVTAHSNSTCRKVCTGMLLLSSLALLLATIAFFVAKPWEAEAMDGGSVDALRSRTAPPVRSPPAAAGHGRAASAGSGAPSGTTSGAPLSFDCKQDFATWKTSWSMKKKEWCCQKHHRGCHATVTAVSYDCNAGLAAWNTTWSESKKQWCCRQKHRGCAAKTTPSEPYDCKAGLPNWQKGWSLPKRRYCCIHKGVACPPTTTPAPRGCDTLCIYRGQQASCKVRIHWAATHQFKGQKAPCKAAHINVLRYCPFCRTECPSPDAAQCGATTSPPAPTTAASYDCLAGFANWMKGWSIAKKDWCCENRNRGCPPPAAAKARLL